MNRPSTQTQSLRALNALAGLCLSLILGACATSGDVKKLTKANQVQDQRLTAVEQSSGREFDQIGQTLESIRRQLRITEGRLLNMSNKIDQLLKEQAAISEGQEKTAARSASVRRRMGKLEKVNALERREQKKELDAMRISLAEVEKLMKSSIAGLPSKTRADKLFREAFSNMVGGQLDVAADMFGKFATTHKKDRRVPEAVYRGGQSFFLMRKYDHATVLFLEMADKYPKHKLAVDARWMLARSLEETGDLKLARELYAQLIADNTIHKADATRRVYFINELYPNLKKPPKQAPQKKTPPRKRR